jgi:hypothetical protein
MTRLYDTDGCLVACPACRRVSGWNRIENMGVPVYQCTCGETAPSELAGSTEEVRRGLRQPMPGDSV